MDPDKNGNPAPNPDDSTPPADGQTGDDKKGGNSKTFTQEDVDRIVKDRLSKVEKKTEERIKQAVSEALAEAERKAKMSDEQKAEEERKKRENETAERERNITLRENRADARELLQEKNIPTSLVDFVVDVDMDKTKENIDKLATAYSKAVEEGVKAKLAGKTPEDYNQGGGGSKDDKKSSSGGATEINGVTVI